MPPYQGNVKELTHPLDLLEFFEFYDGDSHQAAAVNELERAIRKLDPELLESNAEWYKTWTWCVGGKRKR